ncbi:hypothetical protein M9Y10_022192, partial [Tritrichomonas musculus]
RDNTEDEHIPLPIETVYNSVVDSLRVETDYGTTKYYTDNDEHFNRICFKYPSEWRTSNLGEKIIGVRNMSVKWRTGWIKFNIYVRKYDSDVYDDKKTLFTHANEELCKTLSETTIHELIIDNISEDSIRVYEIPVRIRVTSNDNWIDISNHIRKAIDDHNLYNYLKKQIKSRKITSDERNDILDELEEIKDDYDAMLQRSVEWINEYLPFYLQSEDIIVEDVFENNQHILKLRSKDVDYYGLFRSVDILITKSYESGINHAYSLFYNGPYTPYRLAHQLDENGHIIPVEPDKEPNDPD